jgi:Exostosin family
MKIHLVSIREAAYDAMLELHRTAQPQLHTLVDDQESADMILLVGGWGPRGKGVVDNPLLKKYSAKTFIYHDDDGFVPLVPGVYSSAEKPGWIKLHRVESQKYIEALNPNIKPITIEKRYLFSFAGGSTSLLRKRLYKVKFSRPDVLIENTSDYYHWDSSQPGRDERQKQYATTIASSHFGLCPRGASASSFRLYEVMEMGVAPVILSDNLLLPEGPNWDSFAIRVPERKIKELDTILAARVDESAERGRLAREAYEQWFAPSVVFNHVVAACERARENRRIPERWIHPFWGFMLWRARFRNHARGVLKNLILRIFKLMGKPFIYEMNTR